MELGQFFTIDESLQKCVWDFIKNKPSSILEPSIGQGDLVKLVKNKFPEGNVDMFEIDNTIPLLEGIEKNRVIYKNFLKQKIDKKYKTIVGNPPYVKTGNGNLYLAFIEKCFGLLEDKGELVFIVPSDFLKLTSASTLLETLMRYGTFTDIFHPNKENLFKNATIDVIVFRYCKDPLLEKKAFYNNEKKYIINSGGLITFSNTMEQGPYFHEYFDIHVGLVSGKEDVYKNSELGNIKVLNGVDKTDKYVFITTFPCKNEKINRYLLEHKDSLLKRKIRNFNETNWFQWGAPRNIEFMKTYENEECIYVHSLTRKKEIAFKGKICYFGGGLIVLKPKKEYSSVRNLLDKCVLYLNSKDFRDKFTYSGRFKIGQRQLSSSSCHVDFCLHRI